MKAILLCLFFTVFSYVLYAQSTLIEGQSVIGEGLWSQNVCGISHTSNFAIGVSNKYAFGLEELSTSKLAAVAPLNIGVLKCKINRQLSLNFKIAQTQYYDNTPIRSGSIKGDKLTDFKILVKYVL